MPELQQRVGVDPARRDRAPEFLTAREAAERYRVSEHFFAVRRMKGKQARSDGPPWIRVGRRIVYRLSTLEQFFTERAGGA